MHGRLLAPLRTQHRQLREDVLGQAEDVAQHGSVKFLAYLIAVRLVGGQHRLVFECAEGLVGSGCLPRGQLPRV